MLRGLATGREAAAAAARTGKGISTMAREVEVGGDAGGKLVHFDRPLTFTADDLLCATAGLMGISTYGTVNSV
ncbi:hypothetical protein MtrunA17_Chr5g0437711 [Medicago truncatula]|uniref:Uncharacterized protein n=1 Tax=Medicago truncatula TaxID=3880 RepID=A0A396HX87_MEDTR|nr:hypothetical protein MtrunA17_Chr5g0437711 [Medicago truncatula]